tara:strand:- start:162 stop:839 length:678 start_codon:yes stop_codon:yes gene_type:complete
MRLMLIGAPASGKGTQAKLLTERLQITHISTGDMLRQAVSNRTDLGQMIEPYLRHGWLVPDNHVVQLVDDRLADGETAQGFVLDGFPRTLSQAQGLDRTMAARDISLDAIILIEVDTDAVLERVTGRRSDPNTGEIYHLVFDPPPDEIRDRLEQREDDTEEVMRERLATYDQEIRPVLDHYERRQQIVRVDGTNPPEQVLGDILVQLGGRNSEAGGTERQDEGQE